MLGLKEIAVRLDKTRSTVDGWRHRGLLPEPDATIGGRPAWKEITIDKWALTKGRDLVAK
jgi:predicted DNA-binding transcriptional regulator AlpA